MKRPERGRTLKRGVSGSPCYCEKLRLADCHFSLLRNL
jgi:hypothetical protein